MEGTVLGVALGHHNLIVGDDTRDTLEVTLNDNAVQRLADSGAKFAVLSGEDVRKNDETGPTDRYWGAACTNQWSYGTLCSAVNMAGASNLGLTFAPEPPWWLVRRGVQ
jgi:hypothetical protein